MSGPMAIRYEMDGRQITFGGVSEAELAYLLPDIREHGLDPVVIQDGLAEVRERLPAGTRVRTVGYGQWKRGRGTVAESDDYPGYRQWPESGPSAWFLCHGGARVCVRFDGDSYADWWPAHWIEPV